MEYRNLPRGKEKIGVIGLGTSSMGAAGAGEMERILQLAIEKGINYFDLASGDDKPFAVFGRELQDIREKVYYQIHFGAQYERGVYGWTTDLEKIKKSVDWQLRQLKTDYIDFGFLHCIDEEEDLRRIANNGVVSHILRLKEEGAVRHIGLSSHTPSVVNQVLDMGIVDMVMFSINPSYDYRKGDYAIGSNEERMALYRRCEKEGVAISVMKAFGGGQLLNGKTSPFGKALSEYQCLQYALDRLAVVTVLPGVRNREDLCRLLGFLQAGPEERDYSILGTFTPAEAEGRCVYCNHCQPCPAGIDVGLVNKYYDLALAGDTLARSHYDNLQVTAQACTQCGHCDRRCPFHVGQQKRMEEIAAYFGK